MICQKPYGNFRATRPGYGEPKPCGPVSPADSQENIDRCLSCPLPSCRPELLSCPLHGVKPSRSRRPTREERLRRDGAVRDMVRAGFGDKAIIEALHISRTTLNKVKRRLREQRETVAAPAVISCPEEMPGCTAGVSHAVIKYPGAKWGVASWVISHFPEHRSYLEPFFGSGAILFTKERSAIETVNDIDGDVVNLFDWIRSDPEKLAHAIRFTPYARDEYDRAWAAQHTETDSFRRAVNFYIRMMMGHGFRTTGERVGWKNDVQGREAAYAAKCWAKAPEVIIQAAERLRGVQIENRPAVELIRRFNYPNVLIYADPPYMLGTRRGRKQYRHEMTDDDHMELLEALKAHKGPVIISGYGSDLYNRELKGWHRDEKTSYTQTASRRREILWMNFEPVGQMDMFQVEQQNNAIGGFDGARKDKV